MSDTTRDEKFYGYAGSGRPIHEAMALERLAELIATWPDRGSGKTPLGLAAAILESDVLREIKAEAWDDAMKAHWHEQIPVNPYRDLLVPSGEASR